MSDSNPEASPATTSSRDLRSGLLWGCAALLALGLGVLAVTWFTLHSREQRALEAQEVKAQEEFAPALERIEEFKPTSTQQGYDIDRTVRVMHGLELAMETSSESSSLQATLQQLASEDYREVAPEVLEARSQLLRVLQKLYAHQVRDEEQEAMWEVSAELLLGALSTVDVSGDLTGGASFAIDRAQARNLLSQFEQRQSEKRALIEGGAALDNELVDALLDYAEVYYRYMEEWDRLCVLRDRAYLAAAHGDWPQAIEAADEAIVQAPNETEAHLIKALALIESGAAPEGGDRVAPLLQGYIDKHPDRSAPALLLLGVHQARQGEAEQALLTLEQAATYYPVQADQLSDMLNPYRARSFLRKTREGNRIVELYKSTMLGAGYFSPDLELARMAFDAGDFEGGRTRVMDHFARRRSQKQWDFILSDLEFCQLLLGDDYRRIFPEDAWLDLVVKPALVGSGLKLGVRNRSPHTLHNATLVLALRFTDMHPDDYETMTADRTEPAVPAHATTSFGELDIHVDLHGETKGVSDIVAHRAVLVTDEAVIWIDTDAFKIAEAEEFRARSFRKDGTAQTTDKPSTVLSRVLRDTLGNLARDTSVDIQKSLLKDDVGFELPRELAILRPTFRLRVGDAAVAPAENVIRDDHIHLRFDGPVDFDVPEPPAIVLEVGTRFGSIDLAFAPQDDGTWSVAASPGHQP
ncbi:MAG TPA: hypothetical protein DIU15_05550 [Deltaproteobacteria bacterium]|nr:hypothetical protein [Deltaproteobacteria bacterium]HCP45483.1 hypothetical protein [Deltaproteobacteria bacterium]